MRCRIAGSGRPQGRFAILSSQILSFDFFYLNSYMEWSYAFMNLRICAAIASLAICHHRAVKALESHHLMSCGNPVNENQRDNQRPCGSDDMVMVQ